MSGNLTIVFFASYYHKQGTYFRWHNWAIGLQKLGHTVTVLTFDKEHKSPERVEITDGIKYHILPSSKGQSVLGHNVHPLVFMKGMLREFPVADVYHVFQPFPISTLPAYFNRKKAKLFVYDWDDLWYGGLISENSKSAFFPDGISKMAIKKIEDRLPAMSDVVTVCSEFLKTKALAVGAKKVEIVYNGFWEDKNVLSQVEARKHLGLQTDAYYFGFMGRTLNEIEWCFDVLSIETNPHFRLALCGMNDDFKSVIPAEFSDRIDFLGQLSPERAGYFAKAIDCGLLPLEDTTFNRSRFPIKFAEYLANDSQVICSNVGEVSLLAKKYGAVKLAGTSREDWRTAIAEFLAMQKQGNLSLVNKEFLKKELEWLGIAQQLSKLYKTNLSK